jgi:hypothetical protein
MRFLNINEADNQGGHPFTLNDLDTLNSLGFDLMNAITAQHYDDYGVALLSPPRINISGGNFTSAQFWMIYAGYGGIVRIPAKLSTPLSVAPGAAFYIRVTTDFGPNDPVTYQSGIPKNVHAITVGELVHTASPGGSDVPFTYFNVCDWVADSVNFVLSGIDTSVVGGFYSFRYRLLSNNTMFMNISFRGTVTSVVKIKLPLPYLSANNFIMPTFYENLSDPETIGTVTCPADGDEIVFGRMSGSGFTVGHTIHLTGFNLVIETKMRD